MLKVPSFRQRFTLVRHDIKDKLGNLLLNGPPLLLLDLLSYLIVLPEHVFELFYVYRFAIAVHPEYLLVDLLPLLVLVEFDEPLHDDADDQDVHEVVRHQQVDHEEDPRDVRVVRVLQHVHDLVPVLQGRDLEEGQETPEKVVEGRIAEEQLLDL